MRTGWLAIKVFSGKEQSVLDKLLQERDCYCYLPMFRKWRKLPRHRAVVEGRARELIETPLLPGYLFVRSENERLIREAFALDGLIGFLSVKSIPSIIREEEMSRLMSAVSIGNFDEIVNALQDIDMIDYIGRKVSIVNGIMAGLVGIVTDVRNSGVVVGLGKVRVVIKHEDFALVV